MTETSSIIRCPWSDAKNRVADAAGGGRGSANERLPALGWSDHRPDRHRREPGSGCLVRHLGALVALPQWSPSVEKLSGAFAGRLKVVKVNVDDAPSISRRLGVQGIPALFLLQDGEVFSSAVGAALRPAALLGRGAARRAELMDEGRT